MSGGKRLAGSKTAKKPDLSQFSKWMIADCIRVGYTGSLPWISAMVGLPWTAHGVVCSFYLNMAKSDHTEGGITFEKAKANGFQETEPIGSTDSPAI